MIYQKSTLNLLISSSRNILANNKEVAVYQFINLLIVAFCVRFSGFIVIYTP